MQKFIPRQYYHKSKITWTRANAYGNLSDVPSNWLPTFQGKHRDRCRCNPFPTDLVQNCPKSLPKATNHVQSQRNKLTKQSPMSPTAYCTNECMLISMKASYKCRNFVNVWPSWGLIHLIASDCPSIGMNVCASMYKSCMVSVRFYLQLEVMRLQHTLDT